jgi:hypothetical protein
MNPIKYKIRFSIIALVACLVACEDPEIPSANPGTGFATPSANFLLVNASPDAPPLDLFINSEKKFDKVTFLDNQLDKVTFPLAPNYKSVPLTSNGVFQNTAIVCKATDGVIGGVLGSKNLIYRAGNTNLNNLQAIDGGNYTVFVVDTINRPIPIRKNNALGIGDTTFFKISDGSLISRVERAALPTSADRALFPSGATFPFGKLSPLGTVPLGSTDVGGPRFYVAQDIFPVFSASNSLQAAFRFVHLCPNAPAVWVRLKPSSGSIISIAGTITGTPTGVGNFMSFAAFSAAATPAGTIVPSVGSRTNLVTTINPTFTFQTIATTVANSISYTLEMSIDSGFTKIVYTSPSFVTFTPGKIYTIYANGLVGKTDNRKLGVGIIVHN